MNNTSCSDKHSRLNSKFDYDIDGKKYSENSDLQLSENKEQENNMVSQIDPIFNFNNQYNEDLVDNNEKDDMNNDLDDIYLIDFDTSTDEDDKNDSSQENKRLKKKNYKSLSRLCLSNGSIERYNYKTKQPHIIFYDFEATNREVI